MKNATQEEKDIMEDAQFDAEEQAMIDHEGAKLKLVNQLYDTPKDRLIELTVLPKSQTLKVARQLAMSRALDHTVHEYYPDGSLKRFVTIDVLALMYYFQAQRSVDGKLLDLGAALAESQLLETLENEWQTYDEQ